jgi:peptidoglycan/LPS O-acetylase OafA/YrhL
MSTISGGGETPSHLAPNLPSHIPSLDGLRAISILLVLISHLDGTRNFPSWLFAYTGDTGNLGVRVFFVISGFLITTLLLKEVDKTGHISLRGFYTRRTLRIFPAFYAFTLVIAIFSFAGWIQLRDGDLLHGLTYTMNYHFPHSWYMAHIWSLSVEEQFYLLWPAVLLFCGPRRGPWVSGGVILIVPLLRFGTWWFFPNHMYRTGEEFHTVCDALASGCLLAAVFNVLGRFQAYLKFIHSAWFAVVPALGVLMYASSVSTRFYVLFGITILNVCIALCVDRCVRCPDTPFGRLLTWSPLVYAGQLSYSLYLWQQPFLNRHSTSLWCAFPQNIAMVGLCSLASYYIVERPIREYGHQRLRRSRQLAPPKAPEAV